MLNGSIQERNGEDSDFHFEGRASHLSLMDPQKQLEFGSTVFELTAI